MIFLNPDTGRKREETTMKFRYADVCSTETGEVLHTFSGYEANMANGRWMMDQAKKRWLIANVEVNEDVMTIWVWDF
jgi:hypothetical protein